MYETGFGVIGAGTWGELHARVYSATPGARLAAVCDADPVRARQVGEVCGAGRVYADWREMLADTEVQAVSIALPDYLHCEAAVAVARSGRHLLIEKPLATTEEDALEILAAAEGAGVWLMVDFHNRFSPLFQPLKRALEAGDLGRPRMAYYRLNDTVFVPTRMLRWAARSSVAWFLASHCLDTLLWLMDSREGRDAPERLYCVSRSGVLRDEYSVDTPDFYLTTIQWHSGLVTQVENAWILPESSPSVFDLKCEFVGSRGAYLVDGSQHGAAQLYKERVEYPDVLVAPIVDGRPSGFGAASIVHFAECVMQDRPPVADGRDGLAVTRLILKMEESARMGQPVEIGPLYG